MVIASESLDHYQSDQQHLTILRLDRLAQKFYVSGRGYLNSTASGEVSHTLCSGAAPELNSIGSPESHCTR
jgi:hypothetical protein